MGERATKPLGGKAYGSIGHLPQSRLGPGGWHVHEGQARICLEKPRKGDRVIVCEKLDGACMTVANIDGRIIGVPRSNAGRRTDGRAEIERSRAAALLRQAMRRRVHGRRGLQPERSTGPPLPPESLQALENGQPCCADRQLSPQMGGAPDSEFRFRRGIRVRASCSIGTKTRRRPPASPCRTGCCRRSTGSRR